MKSGQLPNLRGKREKFIITTIDGQVVIAGSDRRGTVYGIYELSRQMGVSPWYWWMDVPVCHRDYVGILPGQFTDGEPAVEFRGLFLNDEAPCLTSWVKHKKNQQNLDRFFREGIERMKGTEDMVTIGMRGDGDEAMSAEADTKLLQRIVENQRKIIKQVTL